MKSYFVLFMIATVYCGNLSAHNRFCYECAHTDEGCTKELAGGKLNGFQKNCGKPNAHCFIAKDDDKYERGCKDNNVNVDCKVGSKTVSKYDCIICSEDECNLNFPNLRQKKQIRPLDDPPPADTTTAAPANEGGNKTKDDSKKSAAPAIGVSVLCALLPLAFVARIVIDPTEINFVKC